MSDRESKLGWQTPLPFNEEMQILAAMESSEPIVTVMRPDLASSCACTECLRIEVIKELKAKLSKLLEQEVLPILNAAADLGVLLEFNVLRSPNERKYTGVQVSCTEQH